MMQSLVDNLLLFDPGYARLKTAARGTLAVLCSFFLCTFLVRMIQASPILPYLGVIIAMMGSVALVDLKKKDEKFAILFMAVPATIAVAASIGLADWPLLRMSIFLLVTFVAVLIRRFGNAWTGIGLVMFMAYFSSLFFPFHVKDLPWAALVILIGALITYVTRFWIVPDQPRRILNQLVTAFTLRERHMLVVIEECLQTSLQQRLQPVGHELPALWLPVRAGFIQLNELALGIEQFFERSDSNSIRSSSSAFQLELFEREFQLRRLWDASASLFRKFPNDVTIRADVVRAIQDIHHTPTLLPTPLDQFPEAEDFLRARLRLIQTWNSSLGQGVAVEQALHSIEDEKIQTAAPTSQRFLHISTRQAIQATLATALASLIGNSLSSERWYWASISAFIVFIGASRGDTLIRATLRILGTIVGLGIGFFLAYSVAKQSTVEVALLVSSIFLAIYMSRLNFGYWSALLFSSMFALLYDRMGLMTYNVLLLRVEETLVGALMGVLVASIILPTSTHAVVREAVVRYLRTVAQILGELRKPLPNAFSRRKLIRLLRDMDRDLMNLRSMASPIVGRGSLMKRGGIPGLLHDSTGMAHFLLHLVLHVETQAGKPGFDAACQQLVDEVLEQADRLEKKRETLGKKVTEFEHLAELDPSARHYLKCLRLSLLSLANRRI